MFWSLPPQSRTEFISLCRKSKNAFMSNERHSATRITVKGNLPLQTKKWKVRGSLKEPQEVSIQGGVVALGKFDALHIGHRALLMEASFMGFPWLLSFSGMAEVLGWEPRLPLVSPNDRGRVLISWLSHCNGLLPKEYSLNFAQIRLLSPEDFIGLLAEDLKVKGVVAGENYRFGYKAAGDSLELKRLCEAYGLAVKIVSPVKSHKKKGEFPTLEELPVSSSRVRENLSKGDVTSVAELLGRRHRILGKVNRIKGFEIFVDNESFENQPPARGEYQASLLISRNSTYEDVGQCTVRIGNGSSVVLLESAGSQVFEENIALEF